jgi:hypothetical protein
MLAHSPPLPIIIDHLEPKYDITAEDIEGIVLALQHRDRVRRIRLRKSAPILQKVVNGLDGEFPILEYLYVRHQPYVRPTVKHDMSLNLPETFRAPHLRHLVTTNFAISIGSPLLTTMGNLVTLSLNLIPLSAYFHPNALLQRLSLMSQLEILCIYFNSYYPSRDVERHLLQTPTMTYITLPNLRRFGFQGASAYLEVLLPHVTLPLLEKLQIYFFNQLTYSIPHLQRFIGTAKNLQFSTTILIFCQDYLDVLVYPHEEARMYSLSMFLGGRHLDWQVACAAQVFHMLRTVFSAVEHLTLEFYSDRLSISSEWNNNADRTQWRELLEVFGNVKTLFVDGELVDQLSHALQPGEGESPMELLPELQEVSCFAGGALPNEFTLFIDARQKVGRPVTVVRF